MPTEQTTTTGSPSWSSRPRRTARRPSGWHGERGRAPARARPAHSEGSTTSERRYRSRARRFSACGAAPGRRCARDLGDDLGQRLDHRRVAVHRRNASRSWAPTPTSRRAGTPDVAGRRPRGPAHLEARHLAGQHAVLLHGSTPAASITGRRRRPPPGAGRGGPAARRSARSSVRPSTCQTVRRPVRRRPPAGPGGPARPRPATCSGRALAGRPTPARRRARWQGRPRPAPRPRRRARARRRPG